ncbi:MAG: mannose-1-phosphate guanylyltransferase [Phycisphaerae bacterium]|nr:mannose-1-phosphate guanylyltransferase [Phycisphaerae bacterium]
MRHAVIMAGGAGVRLWPLSRKNRPKQLLRILGGTSLLRQSFERVSALLPPERIHVITNQAHLPLVAEEIPELPAANLIGEPVGRDTANAVGLASAVLETIDSDAVVGIFTADHVIAPVSLFCEAVESAYTAAEEHADHLVTIGVRPTRPDTNYGYIRRGEHVTRDVYRVSRFAEKPDMASAMKYLASGDYYWNSGMFFWRVGTILGQLDKHLPQTAGPVREIARAWQTAERDRLLHDLYPKLMKISIDFAIMERAKQVLVVEMACHWVDLGSWPALETVLAADAESNVSNGPNVIHLASRGNIVVSEQDHLIATIGVDDLVIVHSADATLVCTKRDVANIRELVDEVRKKHGEGYA